MSGLLIEIALKTSVLLGGAATVNLVLRRRGSAASKHLTWTLAVVGLLLLPICSVALPRWTIAIPVATVKAQRAEPVAELARQAPRADVVPADGQGVISPAAAAFGALAGAPIAALIPWAAVLPALYAVGVFLLVIRLAAERWRVDQLARHAEETNDPAWRRLLHDCAQQMGMQCSVRLLRSLDSTMPMAFGIRRPAILIPSVADTWSEDRRRAVLLHELAHIARQDCVTQLLAAVACTVYWIHPGVWWVARRLRVEGELACDDRVLAAGTYARDYAEHLLELAYALGGHRPPALAVSMARPRQIEGRLLAILDGPRNRATPGRRTRLAGVAIVCALVIPLAAAEATGVPAKVAAIEAPARQVPGVTGALGVAQPQLPGTWDIRPSENPRVVHLRLSERDDASHGSTIDIGQLDGFSPAWLSGVGAPVQFSIRRDAGVLAFEGMFRSGVGAGTYTFIPSASFPNELAKRGFASPSPAEQYLLARDDIGFAFLDELAAQGYARPALAQLVRAAQHGVDLSFLRQMGQLGYHLGTVEALATERDHGVSPQYIQDLQAEGLTGLAADDLVRARDHGLSAQYISELRQLGYPSLSLDALVAARNHGISPEYVRALRALGHRPSLDELTRARDHGISSEYIGELTALGYSSLSLDTLIHARDHGISPEYVRELQALGYHLSLDELIKARDHGVSAEYVRELAAVGYEHPSLDALIRARDHGVTAQYVQEVKDRGYDHLTIDALIVLRDRGVAPDGLRSENDRIDNARAMRRAYVDRWRKWALHRGGT
jgi:beta-lactamase regulating signal transducer with metallopeptidase domain